ncbi:AAA family ATPase [uncultured Bilophila sp.]|uniref:AAA family ATPase n=1 Tax=uncultured Bilophila sp. TaxID=529385 RepID=UPI00280B4FA5|nr:AAA family ATPase [uncultured Bilophila sp.]
MSVYNEILSWSQNKPDFIKDALRRIILNPLITDQDINDIVSLIKKENGAMSITLNPIPISDAHIPNIANMGTSYPKLKGIKNPINICALHKESELHFSPDGLTVVYGNNGTGKSSYSRMLKKLCWSRNPRVELKKNLFSPSPETQQANFIIETSGEDINFLWTEGDAPHHALSSIFIFDTDCGEVYVNNENPTEYKPIGVDLLEKLIPALTRASQQLAAEVASYTTQKPYIDSSLSSTSAAQWYDSLESKERSDIDEYIQFSAKDVERKQELFSLINSTNQQQTIQDLTNLGSRIKNICQQFLNIEILFNKQNIDEIVALRATYEKNKQAYDIAVKELGAINTINGFGTNPWRVLWDAAKKFAHSNGMSDGQTFPSQDSLEKCVLCQQELNSEAKSRLLGFNKFILNDVTMNLQAIQEAIQDKENIVKSLNIPQFIVVPEIFQLIPRIEEKYVEFCNYIDQIKNSILYYLHNGGNLNIALIPISPIISSVLPTIEAQIEQNKQFLQNKNTFFAEYNELIAKEFLFSHKDIILRYFDEFHYKSWLNKCQSTINTSSISRKIGELVEDRAVILQHQEFINHLRYFNPELAAKVLLTKTKTSQGNTFQQCRLAGLTDTINSVLSEGEQKIIALSNFLAECTIDGRQNSIIFDDPVNSLDMDYRELIAHKIAELSGNRQVIVLTHDLSFLRLLIDICKEKLQIHCGVVGIDRYNEISGIVTDEIPYLAKNIQERIDSIRKILDEHDMCSISDSHGRETRIDSACKKFRMLLERTVEEVLSNKTYERFSKNIHLKKSYLSSYVVTEKSDIDFLLNLFGKYSTSEHDGGATTVFQIPNRTTIESDIRAYSEWRNAFKGKLKTWREINGY